MTRNSVFYDRGSEYALLFPSVLVEDRRGNIRAQPSDQPVRLRVTRSKDRSSIAELPGTIENKVEKLYYRGHHDLEAKTWDRIQYRDELWDMAVPPVKSGWTRATRHWEIILRSRNKAVPDG